MRESVVRLYKAFDGVFRRPKAFRNNGCCVSREDELQLLNRPREELTEQMLAMPIDHACGCFATLEQISYLVPTMVDLLDETEEGFTYGVLDISFFRLIRDHESEYRALGVWCPLEEAIGDVFRAHTAEFAVRHFDLAACRAKGWGLPYLDLVVGSDFVDEVLGEFFFPLLSARGVADWDAFFGEWADDRNPSRIAHLLDITKRHFEDCLFRRYVVPENFLARVQDQGFAGSLIELAMPVLSRVSSPTYVRDLRCSLFGPAQHLPPDT